MPRTSGSGSVFQPSSLLFLSFLLAPICAACGLGESPTIASFPIPTPSPINIEISVLKAEPEAIIKLLPRAQLLISSNADEPRMFVVVWQSEIGGRYREAFLIPARGTRTVWPDCFYWSRYMIRVGPWQRNVNYGLGVPYCY